METGKTFEVEYKVEVGDSAKALSLDKDDDFPAVLATSRMIALMELAAARLMKTLLQEGELSVGVDVNVTHIAATPVGATVKVVAEYLGMQGKLYEFKVTLFDSAGLAGKGSHTRAIVNTERLLQGAQKRG